MYDRITGRIVARGKSTLVVETGGVGYLLDVPATTLAVLATRDSATVLCHLSVSESDLRLYGFATDAERGLFRLLITVSGIGAQNAVQILSDTTPQAFARAVMAEDLKSLKSIKGIGPKKAEKIIFELKQRLGAFDFGVPDEKIQSLKHRNVGDAVLALVALGYQRPTAERAVLAAIEDGGGDRPTAELVKAALRHIS